ncbi:uncharacterized protein LOC101775898 [Setaria italica]|uniref:uncharacterized protein LOC101775898 n=1 Tax=Setaria italica TaxID=4555 RepID=UPI000647F4CA|nr:uncharacterized protein LOC101775898 [Setaria italica]
MDYSMPGSKDSYSPQVHNLYPHAQPGLYPPPQAPAANPQGGYQYQYQDCSGGAEQPPYSYGRTWPGQPAPSDAGPFYYQDDADCITFLGGWSLSCSISDLDYNVI